MSIEQMEYMITLEQEKKIYLAARKCFISQSALSQQLAKIEKETGFPLFMRVNNQYIPTREGKLLLESFQRILYIYRAAIGEARQQLSQTEKVITLGMHSMRAATLFTYLYPRFKEQYPDYELKLQEMPVVDAPEMLRRHMIDFSLFSPLNTIPEEYRHLYSYHPVAREELVLIAPKDHPLARLAQQHDFRLDMKVLNGEIMALYENSFIVRGIIDAAFAANHIECRNIISFKSCNTIIQFVKNRLALSIIPQMFARPETELAAIRLSPPITQEVGLLSLKRMRNNPMDVFILQLMGEAFGVC